MESKGYHIPRRVDEGFKLFGLGTKDILFLSVFVFIAIIIWWLTPIPTGGKVVLSVFIVVGPYYLLTSELGNGLIAIEYLKLLVNFWLFEQKEYNITSSRSRPVEESEHLQPLRYEPISNQESIQDSIVSEWEEPEKLAKSAEDKEKELEELTEWIPQPKILKSRLIRGTRENDE